MPSSFFTPFSLDNKSGTWGHVDQTTGESIVIELELNTEFENYLISSYHLFCYCSYNLWSLANLSVNPDGKLHSQILFFSPFLLLPFQIRKSYKGKENQKHSAQAMGAMQPMTVKSRACSPHSSKLTVGVRTSESGRAQVMQGDLGRQSPLRAAVQKETWRLRGETGMREA